MDYYTGINSGDIKNTIQRFQKKIELDLLTGCWNWTARKNRGGYGTIKINNKQTLAHRFSYEYWNGNIPKGLVIDHLCRNSKCVNPAHLEAVTQKENIMRGVGIAVINSNKTNCPQGHEYNEENTYIKRNGRYCRQCDRIAGKKYHLKKRNILN